MSRASASVVVPGRISEAEELWFDQRRWPSWLDGFGHVAKIEGDWPQAGAKLHWDSPPGGRGRVLERVVRHEPRVEQVLEVEDARIRGTQRVQFEAVDTESTRVTLSLDYELKERRPWTALLDALFVRRAFGDSIKRTLARFATERRAELP